MKSSATEIIVMIEGIDSVTSDTIQSRYSYTTKDIVWEHMFAPIVSEIGSGGVEVDFAKFHDLVPITEGVSVPPPSQ